MANVLIPKKSTVAAKVPGTSDLALGEIAINHADAKLFARHPSTGIVQEIGGTIVTGGNTNLDGGHPSTTYGGTSAINGGTPSTIF